MEMDLLSCNFSYGFLFCARKKKKNSVIEIGRMTSDFFK